MTMSIEPEASITTLTKRAAVADWVRGQILTGAFPPGSQLQQEEIARRLNVSSTPVREAFATLQSEGLLQSRPHRGFVVSEGHLEDIAEVYEVRIFLETQAVSHLAGRLNDQQLHALDEMLEIAEQAAQKSDGHAYRQASSRFHNAIVAARGSPFLTDLAKIVIARSLYVLPLRQERMGEVVAEHRTIMRLLAEGDSKAAGAAMASHLHGNLRPLLSGQGSAAAAPRELEVPRDDAEG